MYPLLYIPSYLRAHLSLTALVIHIRFTCGRYTKHIEQQRPLKNAVEPLLMRVCSVIIPSSMHTLNIVYLAMLNNMWDIENQLTVQLPKLIAQVHTQELKDALSAHLEETHNHKIRLEELLAHHSHPLTYERDISFETLLQDVSSNLAIIKDPHVKDTFITASAQTVEHIEMSRYQTLSGWAKELGDELGAELLQKTLTEEEHASKKLHTIAQGGLFTVGLDEKAVITRDDSTNS